MRLRLCNAFSDTLPPHVFARICDHLSLRQLVRTSHVCKRWRELVRAHPTFWANIRLSSTSSSALGLFLAQLQSSAQCEIAVEVWLPEGHRLVTHIVLPNLMKHIHRVRSLRMKLNSIYAYTLNRYIHGLTAPRLVSLHLALSRGISFPMLSDPIIFRDDAPLLRHVVLQNVRFIGYDISSYALLPVCEDVAKTLPTPIRNDFSASFPNEILACMFDWLSFDELLSASRVSRSWHAVAHNHRTFWKTIRLRSMSPTSIDRFNAQLSASRNRLVKIEIQAFDTDAIACHLILSATAASLSHVEHLAIALDWSFAPDIFAALHCPVPHLTELKLAFNCARVYAPTIPHDIFTGSAPALCTVHLHNTHIPSHDVRAFAAVTNASYSECPESDGQCGEIVDAQQWLEVFPSADTISFKGGARRITVRGDMRLWCQKLNRVKSLELHFVGPLGITADALDAFPGHASLDSIHSQYIDGRTALKLASLLPEGPLLLLLSSAPNDCLGVALVHVASGKKRSFNDLRTAFESKAIYGCTAFFCLGLWPPHVHEVRIAHSAWRIMSKKMPKLDNVSRITFVHDDAQYPLSVLAMQDVTPLRCPRLKHLRFETAFEYSFVQIRDICTLRERFFLDAPKLELEINGPVILSGDDSLLERTFVKVAYTVVVE